MYIFCWYLHCIVCVVIFCIYPSILICIDSNADPLLVDIESSFCLFAHIEKRRKTKWKGYKFWLNWFVFICGFSFQWFDLDDFDALKNKNKQNQHEACVLHCVHPLLALCRIKNHSEWIKPLALFSVLSVFFVLVCFGFVILTFSERRRENMHARFSMCIHFKRAAVTFRLWIFPTELWQLKTNW